MYDYSERNLSMLSDFYEFTMANGYYQSGLKDTWGIYNAFFRTVPDNGGFAIFCGLDEVISYINNLHFNDDDIEFFKNIGGFSDGFLEYLKNFKFEGDVWAMPEGSVMFPYEPVITVKAPLIQAQILETMVLLCMNHQSLIATKTNRIVRASEGRAVMEFGARRAQGADASILGARAAFVGGAPVTSNTLSSQKYGVPPSGTMAHSWVQSFDSELESFRAYAKLYPNNCTLLVDTYDVLKQGIPNAIKVFDEFLKDKGYVGNIRIDSGDIAYLSKAARKMLDDAGYTDSKIVISNSLDEYKIQSLIKQGAQIDSFGVGERLITAKSDPVFGGVYKLAAIEKDGNITPKIKISENVEKITTPGFKEVYRIYDRNTGKAEADYITIRGEEIDSDKPLVIFDPNFTWKMKRLENYELRKMQVKIFDKGKQVYNTPDLKQINDYCKGEVKSLWDEVKRFDDPHNYYVDLSHKLWDLKQQLILDIKSR